MPRSRTPRPAATGAAPHCGRRHRGNRSRSRGRTRASSELARRPVEAQRRGRHVAVDRKARPGQRAPRPAGTRFIRARASAKRERSRRDHLVIGHQMMAERHRLGGLEMGEARHHRIGMLARPRDQRLLQRRQPAHPPASIASRTHRRKSVATWSLRLRAVCSRPAGPADHLGFRRALGGHVDVFERQILGHALRRHIRRRRARVRPVISAASSAETMPCAAEHGDMRP